VGLIVHPMADDCLGREVPVVPLGSAGIVRCRRCRTYMNPFIQWTDSGRRSVVAAACMVWLGLFKERDKGGLLLLLFCCFQGVCLLHGGWVGGWMAGLTRIRNARPQVPLQRVRHAERDAGRVFQQPGPGEERRQEGEGMECVKRRRMCPEGRGNRGRRE
jgi:hypothetical protein